MKNIILFGLIVGSLNTQALLPLINGGEKVPAHDIIAKSTVMLETEAQYCSATIISNNSLLTAAHCLVPNDTWVIIHFDGLDGKQSKNASRFFRNEAYQDLGDSTHNDVALIFFEGGLPNGFLPVSIGLPNQELKLNEQLLVAGYGVGGPQGVLSSLTLKIMELLPNKSLFKLQQSATRGICHGDSGGPSYALSNGQIYLVGVASYTQEIDCSGYSVYTNAIDFIDWIEHSH